MAALSIQVPYPVFYDRDGQPLDNGDIYIGTANTDALTNQIPVFYDESLTIAAVQPLKTSGGYIYRNGTPAQVYVNANDFSISVRESNGVLVYNFPTATGIGVGAASIAFTGFYGQVGTLADLADADGSDWIGYTPDGSGAVARSAQDKMRDSVSVKDFGAVGDGVANDKVAFENACAASDCVYIPAGNYLIGTSVTLPSQMKFDAGAKLLIGNSITVNFTGEVISGPYQIFDITGTGAVTFFYPKTSEGFAEWWGALPGPGNETATTTGINAALVALRKVKLQAADYWINSRIYMGEPWRELSGAAERFAGSISNFVTRILQTNGLSDVIQVGPDTFPGSINQLNQGNKVNNVYVGRTTAPNIALAVSGIKNQYTLYALFENVMCAESIFGFSFSGTVQTQLYRSWAFRSISGAGGGSDYFIGYYLIGSFIIPGLNSGNGSIYLNYCNTTVGNATPTNSIGLSADSGFTDAFIESFESTACRIGIQLVGNGAPAVFDYKNGNMQIKHPVIDAFGHVGIELLNCNKYGSVEIIGGYYGAGPGASAAISIDNCKGQIRVNGGQALLPIEPASCGVIAVDSNGVTIDGLICIEAGRSGVDASNVNNCVFKPIVKNYSTTSTTAMVRMLNTNSRNIIAPVGYGISNAFPLGVQLVGAGNSFTEINCSGIDPAAIVSGSANKLQINGVQITATGLSGNNLVSGVMS